MKIWEGKETPNLVFGPGIESEVKTLTFECCTNHSRTIQKKLIDNRYKMVKVITDWERSGSGRGMVKNLQSSTNNDDDNTSDDNDGRKQSEMEVYEFWDGDNQKSFLWERPSHVLYLWQLSYTYKILSTVRQQLCSDSTMDGRSAPDVRQV